MSLAVVIPTINEDSQIEICLKAVRREFDGPLIVVDGGSTDATVQRVREAGERVLPSEKGIAQQCNRGWHGISGETILFLSADSRLSAGWLGALQGALEEPSVVYGGFRLSLDSVRFPFPLWSFGGNIRSWYHRIIFPDQGLFVRRHALEKMGGFDSSSEIPHATLCMKLRSVGQMKLLRLPVVSSVRKWEEGGRFKVTWNHIRTFRRFMNQFREGEK